MPKFSFLSRITSKLGKVYSFDDETSDSPSLRLRSVQHIAEKVIADEWTIFINWEEIFDLVIPRTLFKRHRIVNIVLMINNTRVPYFRLVSDLGYDTFNKDHQCPICFEEINRKSYVRSLPCKHIFHDQCIVNWILREHEEVANILDLFNLSLARYIDYYTCPCCQTNLFDWFFFQYYKPSFIKYCEMHITAEDQRMIEAEWNNLEAEESSQDTADAAL